MSMYKYLAIAFCLFSTISCRATEISNSCLKVIQNAPLLSTVHADDGRIFLLVGTIHIETHKTQALIDLISKHCAHERFFFETFGSALVKSSVSIGQLTLDSSETEIRGRRLARLEQENADIFKIVVEMAGGTVREGNFDLALYLQLVSRGASISALEDVNELAVRLLQLATTALDESIEKLIQSRDIEAKLFLQFIEAWHASDILRLNRQFVISCEEDAYRVDFCRKLIFERNYIFADLICKYGDREKINIIVVGAMHLLGPNAMQNAMKKICGDRASR